MSRRINGWTILAIAVVAMVTMQLTVIAESRWSGGPPDGRTGAPGETTCLDCHAGGPDDGSMVISGVPQFYTQGETYQLTVTIQDPGQGRWGFELTAIDTAGNGAGSFTITDATNTQLSDSPDPGRDYVKHTSIGTYSGTANGPVSWQVDWTAPTDRGNNVVRFYAAGNAANNDGGSSGDNIYTALSSTGPQEPVPTTNNLGLLLLLGALLLSAAYVLKHRRAAVR